MRKLIYSSLFFLSVFTFMSCSSDDHNYENNEQNIEFRAAALGFSDVESYKANVAEQCIAGNHENCDILTDGTHKVCTYQQHSGTKHDGSHHNGSDHGTHDANGHSHGSHNSGTHH